MQIHNGEFRFVQKQIQAQLAIGSHCDQHVDHLTDFVQSSLSLQRYNTFRSFALHWCAFRKPNLLNESVRPVITLSNDVVDTFSIRMLRLLCFLHESQDFISRIIQSCTIRSYQSNFVQHCPELSIASVIQTSVVLSLYTTTNETNWKLGKIVLFGHEHLIFLFCNWSCRSWYDSYGQALILSLSLFF